MFKKIDSNVKTILNEKADELKRIDSVRVVFDTYRLVLSPFFDLLEDKKYVSSLKSKIAEREDEIRRLVKEHADMDNISEFLYPIVEHMKKVVRTCKLSHDELKEIIKY